MQLFNFDNELTGRVWCGGVFKKRAQKEAELIDWIVSPTFRAEIFRLSDYSIVYLNR